MTASDVFSTTSGTNFRLTSSEYGVLSCLSMLHRPAEYFRRVHERIEIVDDELVRTVQISVQYPDVLTADDDVVTADFRAQFVVLRPHRNQLTSLEGLSIADGRSCRRLSHEEHVEFERGLIEARLLTAITPALQALAEGVETGLQPLDADVHLPTTAELLGLATLLTQIPGCDSRAEAAAILEEAFDEDGNLRMLIDLPVYTSHQRRLYRLCKELASRYYVVFEFPVCAGERVELTYCYRDGRILTQTRSGLAGMVDTVKRQLGLHPTAFRVHCPLARCSNSYEYSMEAPLGFYFYEQRAVHIRSPKERVAAEEDVWRSRPWPARFALTLASPVLRVLGGRQSELQADLVNVSENADIYSPADLGGGTRAHIFIGKGENAKRTIFAGFRIFEVPPGSTGRAWLAVVSSLAVMAVLLAWWRYYEPRPDSDVPALVAALAAGIPVVTETTLPGAPIVRSPLTARLHLLMAAAAMLLFAVWLLCTGSIVDGNAPWLVLQWNEHGGFVLISVLAVVGVHSSWRIHRVMRTHSDMLRSSRRRLDLWGSVRQNER